MLQTLGAGRAISLLSNSLKRIAQINGDDADAEPNDRYVAFSKFGLYLYWDEEMERWSCPFGLAHQLEDVTGWDPQRLLMSGYGQSTYGDFEPLESWMSETHEVFLTRFREETIDVIAKLKVALPLFYFLLNYFTAHTSGILLMQWTQANVSYIEAVQFMDWLTDAVGRSQDDSEGDMTDGVDSSYWFTSLRL